MWQFFRYVSLLVGLGLLMGCQAARTTVPLAETPRNVIILIGDGMGVSHVSAAMYSQRRRLNIERCPVVGLIKTHALDDLITDSAAGATAFATGLKTYNGAIGVRRDTVPARNIFEIAEQKGRSTGIVVTSEITHATPACFYAHQAQRLYYESIAKDFLESGIDFAVGGGRRYFAKRIDQLNLIAMLEQEGYQVDEFIPNWRRLEVPQGKKYLCFTSNQQPLRKDESRDYLPDATAAAIDFLDTRSRDGFLMLVEGSQIDWGGHANDSEYIISETLDFDEAVGKSLDFAQKDGKTLVIITADHETGGYSLVSGSEVGNIQGRFASLGHTATMVPVFAYGPGAEVFGGIYDNTEVFHKLRDVLGI